MILNEATRTSTYPATASRSGSEELGPITAFWRWAVTTIPKCPVTLSLVLVNILLYGIPLLNPYVELWTLEWMPLSPLYFWSGEFWRALTSGFIHFDWDHVLTNMAVLLLVVLKLEPMIGPANMIKAYVICQVASSMPDLFMGIDSIGASGAVCGMAGILLVCPLHEEGRGRVRLSKAWVVIAIFFGYQFSGDPGEGISLVGHLAGIIAGLLVGASLTHVPGVSLWSRFHRAAAALAVAFALCGALSTLEYWGGP